MGNNVRDIYDNAPPLWDWRRGDPVSDEAEQANTAYKHYLQRRGITAEEHERELGEWLDAQD